MFIIAKKDYIRFFKKKSMTKYRYVKKSIIEIYINYTIIMFYITMLN